MKNYRATAVEGEERKIVIPRRSFLAYAGSALFLGATSAYGFDESKEKKVITDLGREEMRRTELEFPGSIPLGKGSYQLELARMLFGEGRELWMYEIYNQLVGNTALTVRKRARNVDLIDILHKKTNLDGRDYYIYNCFNPNDPNYDLVVDPLKNRGDRKAWRAVHNIAGQLLKYGFPIETTHFWVDPVAKEPGWAKDADPVFVFEHPNDKRGRITRFYDLA